MTRGAELHVALENPFYSSFIPLLACFSHPTGWVMPIGGWEMPAGCVTSSKKNLRNGQGGVPVWYRASPGVHSNVCSISWTQMEAVIFFFPTTDLEQKWQSTCLEILGNFVDSQLNLTKLMWTDGIAPFKKKRKYPAFCVCLCCLDTLWYSDLSNKAETPGQSLHSPARSLFSSFC